VKHLVFAYCPVSVSKKPLPLHTTIYQIHWIGSHAQVPLNEEAPRVTLGTNAGHMIRQTVICLGFALGSAYGAPGSADPPVAASLADAGQLAPVAAPPRTNIHPAAIIVVRRLQNSGVGGPRIMLISVTVVLHIPQWCWPKQIAFLYKNLHLRHLLHASTANVVLTLLPFLSKF
jgi:hypothetical protein